ncbi:MAG: hypothetical protein ACP5NQ_09805, partial [Vulcanisaeta sp.]
IIDSVDDVKNMFNNLKNIISQWNFSRYYLINEKKVILKDLDSLINDLEELKGLVVSTILTFERGCVNAEDLALLLSGMLIPHRAIMGEISGCEHYCHSATYNNGIISLDCRRPRNKNRYGVISNVPLKHYEAD